MRFKRALPPQSCKTMVAATRRGDTYYVYGSTGTVYEIKSGDFDTLVCSCKDYGYHRAAKLEDCKHGAIVRQLKVQEQTTS